MRLGYEWNFRSLKSLVFFAAWALVALYLAPLFYAAINNNLATTYTNELVASLQYARAQAVRRALPVSVCSSNNGSSCSGTPWSAGFIVFVGDAGSGVVQANVRVLRKYVVPHPGLRVALNGGSSVRFSPIGALDMLGDGIARAQVVEANRRATVGDGRIAYHPWRRQMPMTGVLRG